MNFTYTIAYSPDGKFGNMKRDGTTNGMVKQVMEGKADIRCGKNK
jgi:hypothetical protein